MHPPPCVDIDQRLEPDENPEMEGRYYFSVGHEIGHWRLRRQYLRNADGQAAMFTDREPEPTVICRTSQKDVPVAIACTVLRPTAPAGAPRAPREQNRWLVE